MNAHLKNRPLLLAIALSLLLHATLLFGPNLIKLAPLETPLPPLTAHLVALPAIKKTSPPSRQQHPKAVPPAAAVTSETTIPPAPDSAPAEGAQGTVAAAPSEETQSAVVAATPPAAAPVIEAPAHPLPKHAELTFIAYKGANLRIGEARHRLDIDDNHRYTLKVAINTTGIASLFKTFIMDQQSTGKVAAQGLQPDTFTEQKLTSKGTQDLSAKFDWQNKQLIFSDNSHVVLPDTAQDILSFLYQFSQMPLDQTKLTIHVSNGRKLESYQLEVGDEEEISTPIGKLRALCLRKIHAAGEEGLEIWLGLEYRLLPVKVVQIDRRGEIAGELDISGIRVSDE